MEQHYCWMDTTSFAGRLIVPRSDPNQYEWPVDFLFDTTEEAIAWRDQELDDTLGAVSDSAESTEESELAYIKSWLLCRRTIETV